MGSVDLCLERGKGGGGMKQVVAVCLAAMSSKRLESGSGPSWWTVVAEW